VPPTLIVQFVPVTLILQYPGVAETLPGTAADLVVVSFTDVPPNDQPSLAVYVVVLFVVTEYHPVLTLAVQFVV
jgi:hypothetical protein